MLIILTIGLVIAAFLLVFFQRSKESALFLGLCLSLMFEISGVMIFIAKKGGISAEVVDFLYFSKAIQGKIKYFLITLDQLGYLIALGRILFPLFLLEMALNYSMIRAIRASRTWNRIAVLIPLCMLFIYLPPIYKNITRGSVRLQMLITSVNLFWIRIYILIAAILIVTELFSITMKFCRRQFLQIVAFMASMTFLYAIYCRQDPGQVYRFYSSAGFLNSGVGYLQVQPSLFSYAFLVILNVICACIGFLSLARFAQGQYTSNMEDVVMKRKFDMVRIGISMFVHSMKNQLLSTKVIYKRIDQLYENGTPDSEKLREYLHTLKAVNDGMLFRIEELYRSVKSNTITMVPVSVGEIFETAVERLHEKYPDANVEVHIEGTITVLADKFHFCEVLYNLLINGWEAILLAERENGRLKLNCENERLYTVILVDDNGKGMSKKRVGRIFEPFYSSKNANSNWGMGLYYARETVKSHLGSMRVESEEGKGSSFYILLPRYQ